MHVSRRKSASSDHLRLDSLVYTQVGEVSIKKCVYAREALLDNHMYKFVVP